MNIRILRLKQIEWGSNRRRRVGQDITTLGHSRRADLRIQPLERSRGIKWPETCVLVDRLEGIVPAVNRKDYS